MKIAIIKYNAGNTASVRNALERLGYSPLITDHPQTIRSADKVIFPGVGEASSALRYLQAKGLNELIPSLKQPVLGICLGMQLMCKSSEEGPTTGLGIFDLAMKRFPDRETVPHMGWNNLNELKGSLFENISAADDFYFVHSYYVETGVESIAQCNYILPFSAALQKRNFYATQFHPEKSGDVGSKLLENFITL